MYYLKAFFSVWRHFFFVLCDVYSQRVYLKQESLLQKNCHRHGRYTQCKSERSVLALKIGPFRWVKYSPIFESNLAPLNQGQYSPIS